MIAVGWQRVEGGLVCLAALALVAAYQVFGPVLPWWALLLTFLAPDLGFLGYLGGPRVGAAVYNLLHLYGAGLVLAVLGLSGLGNPAVGLAGLMWAAHVGFDRMLGYGLKAPTGFTDTHLGRIGRR